VVLGDVFGDVFGDVPGDVPGEVTPTLLFDPPRMAEKMPKPTPSRSRITMAAAAGTSQGGRSVAWSRTGRRGAGGLRAGAMSGVGLVAGV